MSASAIYTGRISHSRHQPPIHSFSYRLFMLYLDLDELSQLKLSPVLGVEGVGLFSYRRSDYFEPDTESLKAAVLNRVERELGERPKGSVRVLSHVRSWGKTFNPVSFYYCFNEDDELQAVLAEITNTPWGERHQYVLGTKGSIANQTFPKAFHVSPFSSMQQDYHWVLSPPDDHLQVKMTSSSQGQQTFGAQLSLSRRPLTRWTLARAGLTRPVMSLQVLSFIYYQASVLWLKNARFFRHPAKTPGDPLGPTHGSET